MHITTSRTIAAAPALVWALQTDVERWAEHLPAIRRVVRNDDGPFQLGSTAAVTQPAMGTLTWIVTAFDNAARAFTWSTTKGRSTFVASHRVDPGDDPNTSVLHLALDLDGGLLPRLPGVAGKLRTTIAEEAEAFDRWARSTAPHDRTAPATPCFGAESV